MCIPNTGIAGVFSHFDRTKTGVITRRDMQRGLCDIGLLLTRSDVAKVIPEEGIRLDDFIILCGSKDEQESNHNIDVELSRKISTRQLRESTNVSDEMVRQDRQETSSMRTSKATLSSVKLPSSTIISHVNESNTIDLKSQSLLQLNEIRGKKRYRKVRKKFLRLKSDPYSIRNELEISMHSPRCEGHYLPMPSNVQVYDDMVTMLSMHSSDVMMQLATHILRVASKVP